MTGAPTILWSCDDAAAATNGRALGPDWDATGLATDPSSVRPGDLFAALEPNDARNAADMTRALAAGAAAAIVSRRPAGVPPGTPLLLVEDVAAAVEDLGRVARLRTGARIAVVTGALGRTGAKDALAACLAPFARTHAGDGRCGPFADLARLPAAAGFAVFEADPDDTQRAGRLLQPDLAVILNADPPRPGLFASAEAAANAGAAVLATMSAKGTAVLNRDDGQFPRLLAAARTAGLARVLTFGARDGADARVLDCALHATCSTVAATVLGERIQYCLSVPGRHHVANSLAVLLAVRALGGELGTAARALAALKPAAGRGLRRRIALARGSFTMIDESAHASPASVEAALRVLDASTPGAGGRRIAVLADMTGFTDLPASVPAQAQTQAHAALAAVLRATGIDLVFCCGPNMRHLFEKLPAGRRGAHADTAAALAGPVADALRAGDVVLVKGPAAAAVAERLDGTAGAPAPDFAATAARVR